MFWFTLINKKAAEPACCFLKPFLVVQPKWINRSDLGTYSLRPRTHRLVAGWEAGCLRLASLLCRHGSRRRVGSRIAHPRDEVHNGRRCLRAFVGRARFRAGQSLGEVVRREHGVAHWSAGDEAGLSQSGSG